jgi:hypothetical protein
LLLLGACHSIDIVVHFTIAQLRLKTKTQSYFAFATPFFDIALSVGSITMGLLVGLIPTVFVGGLLAAIVVAPGMPLAIRNEVFA